MPPAPDEGYQPGDIVVSVIPTGYLIGQAAEPIGPGPRWTYIAIVPEALGKIGSYYAPLQKAVAKNWEGYSDAELKLLLRFMTQGYDTMLGVLDDLKAKQAMPAAKPPKPARK